MLSFSTNTTAPAQTQQKYKCGICKTRPDQMSHHKSHLETQKHIDKREVFMLKLGQQPADALVASYGTSAITDIVNVCETIIIPAATTAASKKMMQPLTDEEKALHQTMDNNMTISNKEALRDKVHEIHNYLRNHGAGYGMNALKVFNILYGLKKIEENGLFEKVGLSAECRFSYLLQLANENNGEKLVQELVVKVLTSIYESTLFNLLFYEIPKNLTGRVYIWLIKQINDITRIEKMCNVLLSGKIYEYFIGRDESAISELGAYFTDRHIVDFIYQKLRPQLNADGTVPSMIDMFGGSGGFTTGYVDYMKKKYGDQINWETEISKIFHYDMNNDVIKSAGLELFCLTGQIPDMTTNLTYKNSFADEFMGDNRQPMKFTYPITNPPYGGDKVSKSSAQIKREKLKEYIKAELATVDEATRIRRQTQLKTIENAEKMDKQDADKARVCLGSCSNRINRFAVTHGKLAGNDKESCSLMLLMDMVAPGGTAIGVLKEGVFFNKTYKDLRRVLIENYNVREVISIPQDQFENTSTKTSILIFDNTEEKTTQVKFSDLVVERYSADVFMEIDGNLAIVENKGDIKGVSDVLVSTATREELLANSGCSLNSKDYNKKEVVVDDGFKLVALKDICAHINKRYVLDKDEYKYVEISDVNNNVITNYTVYKSTNIPNNASYKTEYGNILISCVRPKSSKVLYIDNTLDINDYVFSGGLVNIKLKDRALSSYVYSHLHKYADSFEKDLCTGSSYPRFGLKQLEEVKIPIPINNEVIVAFNNIDAIVQLTNKLIQHEHYKQHDYKLFNKNNINYNNFSNIANHNIISNKLEIYNITKSLYYNVEVFYKLVNYINTSNKLYTLDDIMFSSLKKKDIDIYNEIIRYINNIILINLIKKSYTNKTLLDITNFRMKNEQYTLHDRLNTINNQNNVCIHLISYINDVYIMYDMCNRYVSLDMFNIITDEQYNALFELYSAFKDYKYIAPTLEQPIEQPKPKKVVKKVKKIQITDDE